MESITEKNCLEEISALVLDANEKVTLKTISNNWSITNSVANEVMLKWLHQNAKKATDLVKEFLVRGTNTKGIFCISIVSEDTKTALEKKWVNFDSFLYSIDMKSNSRKLNLPDYEPIKVKKILLTRGEPRDLHIPVILEVKQEPTTSRKVEPAKKTPFSNMKSTSKPEAKTSEVKKPEVKEERRTEEAKPEKPSTENTTDSEVKIVDPIKDVKSEKSPQENKPIKGTTNKKIQLKNQKPVQKGSITAFFGGKVESSKAAVTKPKVEPIKVDAKPDPKKNESKANRRLIDTDSDSDEVVEVKTRKRSLTPKKRSPTPKKKVEKKPAAKKIKLKELPNKKRSRIMANSDSSEEEEERADSEEPESKLIKFDREFTPEPATPATVSAALERTPEKKSEVVLVKRKAKRMVSKRYESADGFMRTEKVMEEYSASEDENDENRKKNSPPKEKLVPESKKSAKGKKTPQKKTPNKTPKKSPNKNTPQKKKTPAMAKPAQPANTKQGNIRNFFTKK